MRLYNLLVQTVDRRYIEFDGLEGWEAQRMLRALHLIDKSTLYAWSLYRQGRDAEGYYTQTQMGGVYKVYPPIW